MDRTSRLSPLGPQRLRLLECLGGNSPHAPGYFVPAADVDIFSAFRQYVELLSEHWAAESDPHAASLAPPGDSRGRPAYSTSGLQHVDVHVAQREIARGLPEERREAVGNRRTAKRDSSCVARHVEQVTRLRVELVVDLLTIHAGGA